MSVIVVRCTDQVLKIVEAPVVASGGKNEVKVEFQFCEKWDGFTKTAVFYRNIEEPYYAILNSEDVCVVPWEVYTEAGTFYFSVFGDKGGTRRTSITVRYKVKDGGLPDGLMPSDPTPDVYSQILDRVNDLKVLTVTLDNTTRMASHSPAEIQAYLNQGGNVCLMDGINVFRPFSVSATQTVFSAVTVAGGNAVDRKVTIAQDKSFSVSGSATEAPGTLTVTCVSDTEASHDANTIREYAAKGWNVRFFVEGRELMLDRFDNGIATFVYTDTVTTEDGIALQHDKYYITTSKWWWKVSEVFQQNASIEVDSDLVSEGKAADAKATGEAIKAVSDAVNAVSESVNAAQERLEEIPGTLTVTGNVEEKTVSHSSTEIKEFLNKGWQVTLDINGILCPLKSVGTIGDSISFYRLVITAGSIVCNTYTILSTKDMVSKVDSYSVSVDTTLTQSGKAADAKAVGLAIANLDLSGMKVGEVTLETYIGNAVNSYIEEALGGDY